MRAGNRECIRQRRRGTRNKLDLFGVAAHGGTAFSVGLTHRANELGARDAGVILRFG